MIMYSHCYDATTGCSEVLDFVSCLLTELILLISCTIQSRSNKLKVVVRITGKDWNRRAAEEANMVNPAFKNQTADTITMVL